MHSMQKRLWFDGLWCRTWIHIAYHISLFSHRNMCVNHDKQVKFRNSVQNFGVYFCNFSVQSISLANIPHKKNSMSNLLLWMHFVVLSPSLSLNVNSKYKGIIIQYHIVRRTIVAGACHIWKTHSFQTNQYHWDGFLYESVLR